MLQSEVSVMSHISHKQIFQKIFQKVGSQSISIEPYSLNTIEKNNESYKSPESNLWYQHNMKYMSILITELLRMASSTWNWIEEKDRSKCQEMWILLMAVSHMACISLNVLLPLRLSFLNYNMKNLAYIISEFLSSIEITWMTGSLSNLYIMTMCPWQDQN